MDDERAFFSAIRAAPADPVPRLVYADWLEERGDTDRAEFLRLRTQPPDDPEAVRRRERERTLVEGALAHWLLNPGAPVWCLLGGGLNSASSPVPDWLIGQNVASWQRMVGFYADFLRTTESRRPQWGHLAPLARLVNEYAESEAAKLFRAGQSLVTFVVSTAPKYGLEPDEPSVAVDSTPEGLFKLNYWAGIGGSPRESEHCEESDVRPHLARLLARLWADTRGQPS